ncbi:MAG: 60 kDa inner rane insertion protein [Verrucomicrobia bacterium]|nr:60 kDa inner rane insertion protein [Verrucomicrobiota bacterium]
MDKKNTTIGVLLIIAAFAAYFLGQKYSPAPAPVPLSSSSAQFGGPSGATSPNPLSPAAAAQNAAVLALAKESGQAAVTTLENEFLAVHFTNFGGAIRDIALRKFPAQLNRPEPYVFNALHSDPMLGFVDYPGLDRNTPFELVSQTATEVVYRAVLAQQIEVTRRYTLVAQPDHQHDPYQLRHEITLRNLTDKTVPIARASLSLGTVAPVSDTVYGQKLSTGYSTADSQKFNHRSDLEGGNEAKPAILSGGPITWASIDNQFFAAILTPDVPAGGLVTTRVKLRPDAPAEQHDAYGLTGSVQFDFRPLAASASTTAGMSLYVGPKEYRRLSNSDVFKADQDKVMQFGFFKYFSQILLTLMTWVHKGVPNWGVAIILTTLILKIVFVPFTVAASRSAKRMQKIQPEMQAVREKFKDNPQKMQAATMELFKKHKVNPLGGCIPILITMPFFFGFYQMLQSAAELRFEPFLWAADLAAPDTIYTFGLVTLPLLGPTHLNVNIMPLLMGATMIFQMRLTPQPSVDNAQAKMLKFMPYIFILFCYGFSCALALYSTINGLFTIAQQLIINRMKDEGDVASPGGIAAENAAAIAGKPMKNVTPKKGGKR